MEELEPAVAKKFKVVLKLGVCPLENNTSWKALRLSRRKPRRRAEGGGGNGNGGADGLGTPVHLTKYFDVLQNAFEAQRLLRELMLLQEFSEHAHIVQVIDIVRAPNLVDCYVAYSISDMHLAAVLERSKREGAKVLGPEHEEYIVYQLLLALQFIHSGEVLHGDVRPRNVWIDLDTCHVRLGGMADARITTLEGEKPVHQELEGISPLILNGYVSQRAYRAPELLVGATKYTTAADMWSLGCLLIALTCFDSPFQGLSQMDVLHEVAAVLGSPRIPEDCEALPSPFAKTLYSRIPVTERRGVAQSFPDMPLAAAALADALLAYDPSARLTVQEALESEMVADVRATRIGAGDDEYVCSRPVSIEFPCPTYRPWALDAEKDMVFGRIQERCKRFRKGELVGILPHADPV